MAHPNMKVCTVSQSQNGWEGFEQKQLEVSSIDVIQYNAFEWIVCQRLIFLEKTQTQKGG